MSSEFGELDDVNNTHLFQEEREVFDDLSFQFEKLIVYQRSLDFIDFIYQSLSNLPKEEEFRIKSQFLRAAHSIALNIAEGSAGTKSEFKNFLRISKRSVRECVVCSTICCRQKYIEQDADNKIRMKLIELSKMLNGLIKSIN